MAASPNLKEGLLRGKGSERLSEYQPEPRFHFPPRGWNHTVTDGSQGRFPRPAGREAGRGRERERERERDRQTLLLGAEPHTQASHRVPGKQRSVPRWPLFAHLWEPPPPLHSPRCDLRLSL
uniref:Uncharacterized protein n=1 Tax=Myotis myotis TaxID=51298 RepID=A0A7J7ZX28_MYOMY|nr:hypothetical protein mMyoMyo1_009589 [Myotis myotis]